MKEPNDELSQALQEVADDLTGKHKLPVAHNLAELEQLLNKNDQ